MLTGPRGVFLSGHQHAGSVIMNGARRRHSFSDHGCARMGCVAVLIAMLVALCWHGLVTQAHVHYPVRADAATAPGYYNAVSDDAGNHAGHHGRASDRPSDCPICQEQAVAGHYFAPVPFLVIAPLFVASWVFMPTMPEQRCVRRSHCWHSRAPPGFLQN
jgi:hypothetical protein